MSKSTKSVRIRPANVGERAELEALQWRASLANENDRASLQANPDAIHLPLAQLESGDVLVAEIAARIAGFAAIVGGELDGLFVEPDLWRRGIGAALVDAAAYQARKRGLALTVTANPHALGFYEQCGFSSEGDVSTRFGPGIRMSR